MNPAMPGRIASLVAFGALLLASPTGLGAERETADGLFVPVAAIGDPRATLPDAAPVDPDARWPEPGAVEALRSRPVAVDIARLTAARATLEDGQPARLRLNLFEDVALEAVIERTVDTRYGWSLSGRIDGDAHGSVTLVIHGDILAGAVHSREGTYVIASRNGAVHTVQQITHDFECEVHGQPQGAPFVGTTGGVSAATASDGDDGSEVDVLVLFTQAALDVEGSLRRMRASVDLAVAWANDAYEASGVDLRVNLVAAVQIDYQETRLGGGQGLTNQGVDMWRLTQATDGYMDEAHVLRDRYAADVMHLIVDQPGGGGQGSLLRVEDPAASAVSISISLTGYGAGALFAHELGHVMGLLHDRYEEGRRPNASPLAALSPWSYGYVNQRAFDSGATEESRWRTIMSYNSQCRDEGFQCRQLPRFSDPNHNYPDDSGDPLGVPGEEQTDALDGPADAVRSLNENRRLVATFRQSATRCDYRLSDERREIPASGGVFSVEVDADSSCDWSVTTFGDFLSVESDTTHNGTGRVSYRVGANDGGARVGYVTVAGETVSVFQSGAVAPASVCDRTPEFRDAIASAVGRDCAQVSEFDLLEVVTLDLQNQQIASLGPDDLTGLHNLTDLRLSGNPLGTIPDGAFRDLTNLKVLWLRRSGLTAVPRAIRRLPSLQHLDLSRNGIAELYQEDFQELLELRELRLYENDIATLPNGVFSDLRKLNYLYLSWNRITDVRKEALEGPEFLYRLDLNHNPLGELREDAFANVPNVGSLLLRNTQLKALSPATIRGLTRISDLDLSDNGIEDLAGVVFPGGNLSRLTLANNALGDIPPNVFAGFTSTNCINGQLVLDLSGNPGAPFPLTLELARVDAGHATDGPASVVVRVREGAPWPIPVRVVGTGGASFTREVTVVNGNTESEPFEVTGDVRTEVRFGAMPRIPGSYKGVRMALGEPLQLFALGDLELPVDTETHTLDLAAAFARPDTTWTFSATSANPGVATVTIVDGVLAIAPTGTGATTVTVTATTPDGERITRSFAVTVRPPAEVERGTWHGWRLELLRQLEEARTDGQP
ncbi:MAG: M12 family metallo-peptidase [Gammaproteobacteria bacterium]|nr:M12 family metallo-peptidase [Gammaproteobacteria bacterium]